MGQIRAALQSSLPAGGFRILVGAVSLARWPSLWRAVVRACESIGAGGSARWSWRSTIALVYARAASTGNPSVDVVERFHFVEYGLLTMLFYRVWRRRGDLSTLIAPCLPQSSVATLDEWLQWFVPARVGEMRDVVLDAVAIGCGLLFVLGLDPPARYEPASDTRHRRERAALLADCGPRDLCPVLRRGAPGAAMFALAGDDLPLAVHRPPRSKRTRAIAPSAGVGRGRQSSCTACRARINTWPRASGTCSVGTKHLLRVTRSPRGEKT